MQLAQETLTSHRSAHEALVQASMAVAEAQSRMRAAACLAVEAQGKALEAANQVWQLHLALGALDIGTLRAVLLSVIEGE